MSHSHIVALLFVAFVVFLVLPSGVPGGHILPSWGHLVSPFQSLTCKLNVHFQNKITKFIVCLVYLCLICSFVCCSVDAGCKIIWHAWISIIYICIICLDLFNFVCFASGAVGCLHCLRIKHPAFMLVSYHFTHYHKYIWHFNIWHPSYLTICFRN